MYIKNKNYNNLPRLTPTPFIHETCEIEESEIGSWVYLGPRTKVIKSSIGDFSYTASDVEIIYAEIGKFCSIASHVRINPVNHPTWRVTQHHITYRKEMYGVAENDDEDFFNWRMKNKVIIEHDVWIGHGAIILPGVKVGIGAVIGAGAVVTKDVEPYSVVVGVPGKKIKERFPKEIAEKIIKSSWWDWEWNLIKERLSDFNDINLFIEKYCK
ncbi:DapH/DapD/GlmU-related protein [Caldicellulosiruptor morganii]|uniref:Phosphonate metabolim protein, transferase hexapeptide repeat family n=1 Tax=Caldicellulosiruptor morganii TaxID=1387555 RepID=A0ABY7BKW3_9FIRM|nr:DapH/DapD/GlmU-related protein [Caldicellulosiruptor morganii]WAM33483.1 hypothetical protein OTK00_001984 [Caldicellulosiruptor morganii]